MPRSSPASVPPPRPPDWWRLAHDPAAIARRAAALAKRCGMRRVILGHEGDDPVAAFVGGEGKRPAVYISAAIHGDEPAGAEGLLRWWEEAGPELFRRFDFTIVPCLNPGGLRLNIRTDPRGRDLNRCFNRKGYPVFDVLKKLLRERGPYALTLLLHEDYDGCGAYLYELAGSRAPRWGHDLLKAVARHCPTDPRAKIDGRAANRGVMFRNVTTPSFRAFFRRVGMAEAPWIVLNGISARSYTFEAPSEFDLSVRAEAQRAFVKAALGKLAKARD